jgi:hypothetical protein
MIFLAIVSHNTPQDYTEYHIRYEGHTSVDSARKEIEEVRRRLVQDNKAPLDCYVYEAADGIPLYGYQAYNLDDMDFNFYRDLTPEEEARRKSITDQLETSMGISESVG